jgi:hypothetical protein
VLRAVEVVLQAAVPLVLVQAVVLLRLCHRRLML